MEYSKRQTASPTGHFLKLDYCASKNFIDMSGLECLIVFTCYLLKGM
jgi:hypothetical protein